VNIVTLVLGIAIARARMLPQELLDISNVTARLSSIKNKFCGTSLQRSWRNPVGNFLSTNALVSYDDFGSKLMV